MLTAEIFAARAVFLLMYDLATAQAGNDNTCAVILIDHKAGTA
jgi:hypothetical protein